MTFEKHPSTPTRRDVLAGQRRPTFCRAFVAGEILIWADVESSDEKCLKCRAVGCAGMEVNAKSKL